MRNGSSAATGKRYFPGRMGPLFFNTEETPGKLWVVSKPVRVVSEASSKTEELTSLILLKSCVTGENELFFHLLMLRTMNTG